VSRRKMILGFWLRLLGFALVLSFVLSYAAYVLTPKYDYGICPITNLYRQEQNSIDVLALGTSCAYAGVNTNVLWEEYGIAAYNLCGAEQPYWISYYYLEEALKTQKPKLILLDAKAALYNQEHSKRGRTILSTYGIRSPITRMKAISACVDEADFAGFALAFPEVHSNYSQLTAESFAYPPTNGGRGADWKGYIEMNDTDPHQKPTFVWTDTQKPIHEKQAEYFVKTVELAKEHGIPVLLVGYPTPDYANEHLYFNSLWALAEANGVQGMNYNDPTLRVRMSYSSHFADWQHMNIKGSVVFSRRLGSDLRAMFNLPDRRGDAAYDSWARCAQAWYAQYPEYLPEVA